MAITLNDITITITSHPDSGHNGEVLLRLGHLATLVPAPFSDLVLQLVAQRSTAGGDR